MEIVLHQINVHVILDGVVQIVANVHMDTFQKMEIVVRVVNVIIMEHVQMDQVEQVCVHVILVIQLLMVQLAIVPLVLMATSWKTQFVLNVLKLVKRVLQIQLIVLRNFSFFFSFSF